MTAIPKSKENEAKHTKAVLLLMRETPGQAWVDVYVLKREDLELAIKEVFDIDD